MRGLFWIVLLGFALAAGWLVWHSRRKLQALRRAEEERFAAFMAETAGRARPAPPALPAADGTDAASAQPAAAPAGGNGLGPQKLLFEAAHKAGEAGEPALAIQLYARLLSRYPTSAFAEQARAAVEAQKKRLSRV
jgi:TolA-binding protein